MAHSQINSILRFLSETESERQQYGLDQHRLPRHFFSQLDVGNLVYLLYYHNKSKCF